METLTSIKTGFHPLLDKPRVYADLNGGWRDGDNYILWLTSSATESDLQYFEYTLVSGSVLDFWTDDGDDEGRLDPLLFQGKVEFDEERQTWYAVASWNGFQNASELKKTRDDAAAPGAGIINGHVEHTGIKLSSSTKTETASAKSLKKL